MPGLHSFRPATKVGVHIPQLIDCLHLRDVAGAGAIPIALAVGQERA
jgi:hypothetical protein